MALCSESTGRSGALCRRAAAVMRLPAMTSGSLLAMATALPDSMAAMVGRSPRRPRWPRAPRRSEITGQRHQPAGASEESPARMPEGPRERIHCVLVRQGDHARTMRATELGHQPGIPSRGRPDPRRGTVPGSGRRDRGRACPPSPWPPVRSTASCVESPSVGDVVEEGGSIEEESVDPIQMPPCPG
jgi:hypothetical protein